MALPTGVVALAAAGLHQDATGFWYGPLAVLPGGTPYCFSTTGTVSTATSLTIAAAAGAYAQIQQLFISGSGLPAALGSALLSISGGNQNFLRNLWSGPALGLAADFDFPGWGLIASAQNTALVISVPAITLVTISITALGIYV